MKISERIFRSKRFRESTTSQLSNISSLLVEFQPLLGYLSVLDALGAHLATFDALGVRMSIIDDLGARVSVIDEMAHSLKELRDVQQFYELISIVKPAVDNFLSGNHQVAENVRSDVEALSVMMSSLQIQLNRLEILLKDVSV
jgi:hypothetical protein